MLNTTRTMTRLLSAVAAVFRFMTPAHSQGLPPNLPTKEQLVNRNNFFLSLARKALKWEEPAVPIKLVGPCISSAPKGSASSSDHTRGATTWVANIVDGGKPYIVAFPDGAGFNPGYRLAKNPSYPGINDD